MSDKKPDPTPAEVLQQMIGRLTQATSNRQAAEAARWARLTPEQRAAEQAAAIAQRIASQADKFRKMGPAVLARESWSIADFAWLLAGGNPQDSDWGFLGRDDAQPEPARYRSVLESCVGVTLSPVDASAPREGWRFRTGDLIATAERKSLGLHAALRSALTATTSFQTTQTSGPVPAGPSPVLTGAPDRSDNLPSIRGTGAAPVATGPAAVVAGTASPESTGAAPVNHGVAHQIAHAVNSGPSRTKWHLVLDELAVALERGAIALGETFDRTALPESKKALHGLVLLLCQYRNAPPPGSPDATYKQLQRSGYRFGGAGHKNMTGALRRLAEAGGLAFPPRP